MECTEELAIAEHCASFSLCTTTDTNFAVEPRSLHQRGSADYHRRQGRDVRGNSQALETCVVAVNGRE